MINEPSKIACYNKHLRSRKTKSASADSSSPKTFCRHLSLAGLRTMRAGKRANKHTRAFRNLLAFPNHARRLTCSHCSMSLAQARTGFARKHTHTYMYIRVKSQVCSPKYSRVRASRFFRDSSISQPCARAGCNAIIRGRGACATQVYRGAKYLRASVMKGASLYNRINPSL